MVKIVIFILFANILFANTFSKNCLSCHSDSKELKIFMSKYTLKYSSEKRIKNAIFRFLKSPTSNKSIMPYSFIVKYGFKDESNLDDEKLKKAIDTYYLKYKLNNFIK